MNDSPTRLLTGTEQAPPNPGNATLELLMAIFVALPVEHREAVRSACVTFVSATEPELLAAAQDELDD